MRNCNLLGLLYRVGASKAGEHLEARCLLLIEAGLQGIDIMLFLIIISNTSSLINIVKP